MSIKNPADEIVRRFSWECLVVLSLWTAPMVEASPWDGYNDPTRFRSGYEYHFSNLPLQGEVARSRTPWSETYWPRNRGSINLRWNADPQIGFQYHSPSREEAMHMSQEELRMLSPSEKYDLFRGRYDYPLKNYIDRAEANPNAPNWAGICDGWSAAAIEFREPKAVSRLNPDGVLIPFGASDVKGLMSYSAARQKLNSIVIGRYCPFGLLFGFSNCQDINPGAFHVILANELGIKHESFPADIEPGHEAWNQPILGFQFEVLGSAASLTGLPAVRIHSRLHYVDELDRSSWEPVTGTSQWRDGFQESDYILELDLDGKIVGGSWLSKYSHPDVFWRPTKSIEFSGEFARLKELYEPID